MPVQSALPVHPFLPLHPVLPVQSDLPVHPFFPLQPVLPEQVCSFPLQLVFPEHDEPVSFELQPQAITLTANPVKASFTTSCFSIDPPVTYNLTL